MLYRSQRPPHLTRTTGRRVIEWVENFCVFTVGPRAGEKAELLQWEKDFILALFAQDPETGKRWYRWALLGLPKKNGKGLKLDQELPAPGKMRVARDVRRGDQLLGRDGLPVTVTGVYPQGTRPLYRLYLSSGDTVDCDDQHLWIVEETFPSTTRRNQWTEPVVKSVTELRGDGTERLLLPQPIEGGKRPRFSPYALGLLLGDGHFAKSSINLSTADEELAQSLAEETGDEISPPYERNYSRTLYRAGAKRGQGNKCQDGNAFYAIRRLGLAETRSDTKFIPDEYLYADPESRLAILQGLLDSDGRCRTNKTGGSGIVYGTTSPHLRDGVRQLVASLGGACGPVGTDDRHKKDLYWFSILLPNDVVPFRLERKQQEWRPRVRPGNGPQKWRKITRVERLLERAETVCFRVDAKDSLFLVGREHLVTHNTEFAAWLGLYFLLADGERTPWVGIGASAEHQADLAFSAARRCAEWSLDLAPVMKGGIFDRHLEAPHLPGSKLVRLTGATGSNDGPSWSALILDELHEWTGDRGRKLWTILTNGTGAREQPVILQITTAGFDKETVCGEQYDLGRLTVDDWEVDPRFLFWWYEPEDPKCDYKDEEVWRDVNPSWGVSLLSPLLYLRDQSLKKTESEFRRYFLNQWVEAEDIWLPWGVWDECEEIDLGLRADLPLYVGIDGALKRDTFAIVVYQPQPLDEEREAKLRVLAESLGYELPERVTRDVIRSWIWANPYPKGHRQHADWKLNLNEPKQVLRDLREEFPEPAGVDEDENLVDGPVFGYDPMIIELMAIDLEDEGLNMIEVPQTDARMCPASATLYEKFMTRVIAHEGDPRFRTQVHSAVQKIKDRGWRLARPKNSRQPIDAAIALAMAAHMAHNADDVEEGDVGLW